VARRHTCQLRPLARPTLDVMVSRCPSESAGRDQRRTDPAAYETQDPCLPRVTAAKQGGQSPENPWIYLAARPPCHAQPLTYSWLGLGASTGVGARSRSPAVAEAFENTETLRAEGLRIADGVTASDVARAGFEPATFGL
jgi:hypothetical protein